MKKTILTSLSMITQLGISIITPVLLCVLGASWLRDHFGLGNFVMVIAILLGIGAGILRMMKMLKQMEKMMKEDGQCSRREQKNNSDKSSSP